MMTLRSQPPWSDSPIDELAAFSDSPAPSVTRVLYTDKDVLGRRYVKTQMELAGLSVREDAVGNIFGRWDGVEPELAAVATGSHIDAIPYSGKYDGVIGVLGAIEAIRVPKRSGFKPRRSLEVILFTSEEPTRFGIGSLGSRLLAGKLHIEQGPILEDEGISIGIVTAIAAPASLTVEFEGNGGHAGAVLMPNRNDAGLAASELALAVERHVLDSGSIDTVGTVDTRDIDEERRNKVVEKIHQSAIKITKTRGVKLSDFHVINQDPPALSDEAIIKAVETATKELNLTSKLMISRAYHDSLFMARLSPMGMIFIPCYKGYSHKPEEFATIQDMSNGVKVLTLTLAKLSSH
ncbi:Ureidoglycolate hydrolase [Glycine soja]